jgi:hypothetical protein
MKETELHYCVLLDVWGDEIRLIAQFNAIPSKAKEIARDMIIEEHENAIGFIREYGVEYWEDFQDF